MQSETLQRIHKGHQGIARCPLLSKISVWQPGIARQIAQQGESCQVCSKEVQHRREPLMPTEIPDYPWQTLGSDLFELNSDNYLLMADYYSRYMEIV